MRRNLALLILAFLIAPTLVPGNVGSGIVAQEIVAPPEPVPPPRNCDELFTQFGGAVKRPRTRIEAIPDGCQFSDFSINERADIRFDYFHYRIGMLTVIAPGLFEALAAGLPPPEADIAVTGFRMASSNPVQDYLQELQTPLSDMNLAYRWDDATGALTIDELSFSGPSWGRLALSAQIEGIHAATFAAIQDDRPPAFVLREVEITLDDEEIFSNIIVPSLLWALSPDEDPRVQIARYQQMINAEIEDAPERLIDADSKTVLTGLVDSFPKPEGIYTLTLRAEDGIDSKLLSDPGKALELLTQPDAITVRASHRP